MKKITIVWLVNDCYVNNMESVYRECMGNPLFNIIVLAVPHVQSSDLKEIPSDVICNYLNSKNIKNINSYSKKDNTFLDLESLNPDYVFYLTPYNYYLPAPYQSSVVKKYAKVCHISYGGSMIYFTKRYLSLRKNDFISDAYKIFHETSLMGNNGYSNKYVEIGCLKLDDYFYYNKKEILNKVNKRKIVIWKPRWTLEEGDSHFWDYIDTYIELIKSFPDVDFKIYYHPLFEYKIEHNNLKDVFDKYKKALYNLNNYSDLSGSDFLDDILGCDIFISDHGSTISEFSVTGKAMVYTECDVKLNKFGEKLVNNSYVVSNKRTFKKAVQDLLHDIDEKKEKREKETEKMFFKPPYNMSCAKYLLYYLLEDSINNYSNKIKELENNLNDCNEIINKKNRDLDIITKKMENMQENYYNIINSKSWKLTKPLRKISSKIRRKK